MHFQGGLQAICRSMGAIRTINQMGASLTALRFLPKNSKSYQEAIDIWDLYCMTYYYRHCGGQNVKMSPPDPLEFDKQYQEVIQLLRNLQSESKQSFSLSIKPSTIQHPEAGEGVFLDGSAVPGTVVMFHPGLVYLPPYIRKMPNYPWIDKDNTYLMSRYDGCIVDPKGLDTDIQRSDGTMVAHPLAAGHKVNHAPPGTKPNILPFSYDFAKTFPEELLRLVPNKYVTRCHVLNACVNGDISTNTVGTQEHLHKKRMKNIFSNIIVYGCKQLNDISQHHKGSVVKVVVVKVVVKGLVVKRLVVKVVVVKGLVVKRYYREPNFLFKTPAVLRSVVYVTTNHVHNQELFVNYRLNPAIKLPEWYTPVDRKEDLRRWNG
ncbi:predicted protein [Nematostella vectensis]|uniref:Uncharacterized protein n=1 Tax=Nematostella vectensis TaxID=45351 RepID=A7SAV8_NEMVE|nr:predicted protein [Nematostella vectensis]|eukprot:XP_001631178.1 predicted protein [Nematostella vectensis]